MGDNVIIVSAGNYMDNLNGMNNMILPILNRFAIINLRVGGIEEIDNFLFEPKVDYKLAVRTDIHQNLLERFRDEVVANMKLNNFDFNKPNNESYEGDLVLGSPSPRSMYYLSKCYIAIANSDLTKKLNTFEQFVNGLFHIGEPTNKFIESLTNDLFRTDFNYSKFDSQEILKLSDSEIIKIAEDIISTQSISKEKFLAGINLLKLNGKITDVHYEIYKLKYETW